MGNEAKPQHRLPVQQLAILSICRFAEPISLTSIFPYLPSMIASFHVAPDDIAFWAGACSAIYSFCQAATAIWWGRLSDRFGRKPIILIGLFNTCLTSLLWGFARSLPMAMVARALSGAGNGNVGIIRTMVAEMVPYKELQPRAFSIMPLVYNIGSVIGPSMGGAMANPYGREPDDPPDGRLLSVFPFALPNIVAAAFFFVGITTGLLYLHETLDAKHGKKDWGRRLGERMNQGARLQLRRIKAWWSRANVGETESLINSKNVSRSSLIGDEESTTESVSTNKGDDAGPPTFREVLTKQACLNLLVYTLLAMHSIGYDQLIPVFLHHPKQDLSSPTVHLPFRFSSGFGLDSARIGILFTCYGLSGFLFQFFVFPPVAQRFGVLFCLRVCALASPLIYAVTPFSVLVPSEAGRQATILIIMLAKNLANTFAFPCVTILMTNSANSLRVLATLNGIATSTSAIGRALGPIVCGSAFSLGVKHSLAITPFLILMGISGLAASLSFFMIEGKGFGDDEDEASDESDDTEDEIEQYDESEVQPQLSRASSRRQASAAEDEPQAEASADSVSPLLSRSATNTSQALTIDAEDEGEDEEQVPLSRRPSRRMSRKSSIPLGAGRGFRRMSSNLGQSRSGYGTGAGWGYGG